MLQENTLDFYDHYLAVTTDYGATRCVPFARLTELSVSQPGHPQHGEWVVTIEIDGAPRVRLATFPGAAGAEALQRAADWAARCFAPGHTVTPLHSHPKSETPKTAVQGRCLQHVAPWGTQFLPVACVQEVVLQAQPSARGWIVAAHIAGNKPGLLLGHSPIDDRARAEQCLHGWATRVFEAQATAAAS